MYSLLLLKDIDWISAWSAPRRISWSFSPLPLELVSQRRRMVPLTDAVARIKPFVSVAMQASMLSCAAMIVVLSRRLLTERWGPNNGLSPGADDSAMDCG